MSLNLNSNEAPAKFTLNTSKIALGVSINLSKTNPNLKRFSVKIAWEGDDLDINAVGLGEDGKAVLYPVAVNYKGREEHVPRDLIFYMNLEQSGMVHGGDIVSSGDLEEEQINVATSDLLSEIKGLDFIVTSHVDSGAPLLFSEVSNMSAQLIDMDTNEVVYETALDCSTIGDKTSAVFASIREEDGEWSYKTELKGLGNDAHGVQGILTHYYS